jgi:hypothetical protein
MSQVAPALMQTVRPEAVLRPASWFVRRALIGVGLLSVFVIVSACLLYNGIDPDAPAGMSQSDGQSE